MNKPLYLILILILTACDNVNNNKKEINSKQNIDSLSLKREIQSFDTTLINNNLKFDIKTNDINSELKLLNLTINQKTILIDTIYSQGLAYIEYPDFNNDGNSDILVDYIGNNSTYYLYLFDPKTNMFKSIENYMSFPDAIQLKSNSKYYYSYQRAGCADDNWVSDLFKIENFKIIPLGHIEGKGCENPPIIEIYKVTKVVIKNRLKKINT